MWPRQNFSLQYQYNIKQTSNSVKNSVSAVVLRRLKPNDVYSYDVVGRRSGWNCCWCHFVSPRHSKDKAAVSRRFCQSWWLQRNIFRDCFCRKWFSSCRWCIYDSFSWTLSFWPFNSHKWLRQNYSFPYGYNIKQEWWE